jgi:predicted ABC-type ATPase
LQRIRDLIQATKSFTWETTLSGRTAVLWLRQAREAGYMIKAYFLWVRDVELTLRRIQQRVVEGGHNIPVEIARRRFWKTLQNLLTLYRPLFDSWRLIENDGPTPRLLAVEKEGRLAVRDRARFEAILAEAQVRL